MAGKQALFEPRRRPGGTKGPAQGADRPAQGADQRPRRSDPRKKREFELIHQELRRGARPLAQESGSDPGIKGELDKRNAAARDRARARSGASRRGARDGRFLVRSVLAPPRPQPVCTTELATWPAVSDVVMDEFGQRPLAPARGQRVFESSSAFAAGARAPERRKCDAAAAPPSRSRCVIGLSLAVGQRCWATVLGLTARTPRPWPDSRPP